MLDSRLMRPWREMQAFIIPLHFPFMPRTRQPLTSTDPAKKTARLETASSSQGSNVRRETNWVEMMGLVLSRSGTTERLDEGNGPRFSEVTYFHSVNHAVSARYANLPWNEAAKITRNSPVYFWKYLTLGRSLSREPFRLQSRSTSERKADWDPVINGRNMRKKTEPLKCALLLPKQWPVSAICLLVIAFSIR